MSLHLNVNYILEQIKDKIILIFFYIQNRRKCIALLSYLNMLEKNNNEIIVIKLEYEKNKSLFEKYNITQVPTILLKKGETSRIISSSYLSSLSNFRNIEEQINLFRLEN